MPKPNLIIACLAGAVVAAACVKDERVGVVYAQRNLNPGVPITADDVEIVPTTATFVAPTMVSDASTVVGIAPRERVLKGEPLRLERLGPKAALDARVVDGLERVPSPVPVGVLPPMHRGWGVDEIVLDGPTACIAHFATLLRPLASDPPDSLPWVMLPSEAGSKLFSSPQHRSSIRLALRNPLDVTLALPTCDQPDKPVAEPAAWPLAPARSVKWDDTSAAWSVMAAADLHPGISIEQNDLFLVEPPKHAGG